VRDWRGPIAFVLALGVAISLVSGVITAEVTPGKVTTEEAGFFSTLGGAIVGAVATYLGLQHRQKESDDNMRETTETPERDEPVTPEPAPEPERAPSYPDEPAPSPPSPEPAPEQPPPPPPDRGI